MSYTRGGAITSDNNDCFGPVLPQRSYYPYALRGVAITQIGRTSAHHDDWRRFT
jgi:hypothetical protein